MKCDEAIKHIAHAAGFWSRRAWSQRAQPWGERYAGRSNAHRQDLHELLLDANEPARKLAARWVRHGRQTAKDFEAIWD